MPELSRFYGIVIFMYYNDHAPPHFHARYGNDWAVFEVATGKVVEGQLPRRATRLVQEWAEQRRAELEGAWQAIRSKSRRFDKIPPLE